jgi:hypothetical protein
MSQFCSLDEAFGPVVAQPGKKTKKTVIRKEGDESVVVEGFVPSQLPTGPAVSAGMDPDRPAARPGPAPPAMQGASASGIRLEAGSGAQEFFPIPGETAQPEEWAKAFMLEPSQAATISQPQISRFRGPSAIREAVVPAPVNGLPTLWRDASAAVAPISSDISARLDTLTKQLDSLTTATPMQSTAELFLFVAIGLLILLAIDSILRFATAMVSRNGGGQRGGARRMGGRWRS